MRWRRYVQEIVASFQLTKVRNLPDDVQDLLCEFGAFAKVPEVLRKFARSVEPAPQTTLAEFRIFVIRMYKSSKKSSRLFRRSLTSRECSSRQPGKGGKGGKKVAIC